MARIELRNCTVKIKDGFGGSAIVDDDSISNGNTTLEVDIVSLVNNLTIVPVGARFKHEDDPNTVHIVTAQNANKVFSVEITADDGSFTLTANGEETDPLDHDASVSAIQAALDSALGSGKVLVAGAPEDFTVQFIGTLASLSTPTLTADESMLMDGVGAGSADVATVQAGGTTWQLTFTPPLATATLPDDGDDITFYPQELIIKIGDGDLNYTENDEFIYDLDRGELDGVRQGEDQPMEVALNFVYEHITTGTNEQIAPMDAIKRRGGAANWVSASEDKCEPYCVDIEVTHTPPCGTSQVETTTFPDFRSEQREVNFRDANVSINGRCNATEPIVARS